jgi:hypothetical protein
MSRHQQHHGRNSGSNPIVIDTGLIAPLVSILSKREFEPQQEAAHAFLNALISATDAQMRYFMDQNLVWPMCGLLTCDDPAIILVALESLDYLLRGLLRGKNSVVSPHAAAAVVNPCAHEIESCGGLDSLESLPSDA